ncbi:hypothetical protein KAFR_0I02000 [Kazachstania africana CBS 2517]|uniref:WHIM1 domain-containing protein n=1 Tax=Kazachstania africana (strain ATCC 22294 / BCRC 22015 / CBS 2517 / CECT 1963 / NBRC 1671 / NRRL Y-8276) TaxID=1071382 RepID=H2B030_KAZAF|nr:hypothetical protein KAFR_0I02000 [Kazachstania africana CBS 2517]CCF59980.1 hypothetical protein KAFR_0I02000 [Kazachstania africana CBS 2517]
MTNVINLDAEESSDSIEHTDQSPLEPPHSAEKKKATRRQMTFDDFKGIKVVHGEASLEEHKTVPRVKKNHNDEESTVSNGNPRKRKAAPREFDNGEIEETSSKSARVSPSPNTASKLSTYERALQNTNSAPVVPLPLEEFRDKQTSLLEAWKSKNEFLKPVSYAGDVIKIMSFLHKFQNMFHSGLQSLSFIDFEIGLELIANDTELTTKELLDHQDKLNLIFYSILKLVFDSKNYVVPSIKDLKQSRKPFAKYLKIFRRSTQELGSPKEWRIPIFEEMDVTDSQHFPSNEDVEDIIQLDTSSTRDMSPIYDPCQNIELPRDEHPLFNKRIISAAEKDGLFAMEEPTDRLIALRHLIDIALINSGFVHDEIYRISHTKGDPSNDTTIVPRFYRAGMQTVYSDFESLCKLIQNYLDENKRRLKSRATSKNKTKFDILAKIKGILRKVSEDEKESKIIGLYDKWIQLFEGLLYDNPLSDPYTDDLYRLRLDDFFVGRISKIGDFYFPRLYTQNNDFSTFIDLRKLTYLFDRFLNKEVNLSEFFENSFPFMSSKFKLFYHDKISLLSDTLKNEHEEDSLYWFEIANDSTSMAKFLDYLNIIIGDHEVSTSNEELNGLLKIGENAEVKNDLINLRCFLSKLNTMIIGIEQLKKEYEDFLNGDRRLRRSHNQKINYNVQYNEDGNEEEEEEEEEENEEEEEYQGGNLYEPLEEVQYDDEDEDYQDEGDDEE